MEVGHGAWPRASVARLAAASADLAEVGHVLAVPRDGGCDPVRERLSRSPPQRVEEADVQQLARRAVGLRGVPQRLALVAHHAATTEAISRMVLSGRCRR